MPQGPEHDPCTHVHPYPYPHSIATIPMTFRYTVFEGGDGTIDGYGAAAEDAGNMFSPAVRVPMTHLAVCAAACLMQLLLRF